jgi:hypothetical protein
MARVTVRLLAFLSFCALAPAGPLAAQTTFAELRGTVVDEQGAAVPGATVTATHVETGQVRTTVTSETGSYLMPALPVGLYIVRAELPGFTSVVREGLRLAVGESAAVHFTMKVAALEETITVAGAAPLLDTKSSGIAGRIEPKQVENLPLNGRDWLGLVALVPGARGNPGSIQAGAAGSDMAKYNVDGIDISNQCCGGANQGYSQENVAEFVVLTNRFDAEHGRVGGAVINAVTKSGTNQIRATGFGYFRNKRFGNAKNFFTDTLDPLDHRQMGLNGGGPLVRDRAFYFGSFEYQKQLLTARPNTGIPEFDVSVPNDITRKYVTARLDTALGNHRLFVRGSIYNWEQLNVGVQGSTAVSGGYSRPSKNQDLSVGETWVITPRLVNEIRAGFSHIDNQLISNSALPRHQFPSMTFGSPTNSPQYWEEMNIQVNQSLTYFVPSWFGEHSMKMGVQIFRPRFWGAFPSAEPWAASYVFNRDPADFNDPRTYPRPTRYSVVLGDPSYLVTNWTYGGFFQDNWTINRRLTLNLGLRYDLETGTTNRDHPNPLQPDGRSLDADNVSPRLGFAYDVRGDGRTVVRGGWGRYYDKVMLNITSNEQRVVLGRYLTAVVTNPPYENPLGGLTFDDFKSRGIPAAFIVLTKDFRTPVNDQVSVGVARQLGDRYAVQADFVHADGRDEPLNYVMNFFQDPATGLPLNPAVHGRPYPQYTNITWNTSLGKSRYDGLQLGVNGRGARYSFQASYTLSVTKDNHNSNRGGSTPTNPFDLDKEYTYSGSDQRHRFVLNGLVTLPYDIQVAGIFFAGSPRTIDVGTTLDPFGLGYTSRWLDASGRILPRNSERTDSDYKLDLRLARTFAVGRVRVQGIAEVFNVFNRENHDRSTYGTNYFGRTYLQPSTSTNLFYQPRQIQLGFRVSY